MATDDLRRVKEIMTLAFAQMAYEVGMNVIFSWGLSRIDYTVYEGMPTMMMRVRGFLHDGYVYVSLNEDKDLYEIRIVDLKGNVTKIIPDVYGDMLGSLIDENVERGTISEDEYNKKCQDAFLNLFSN